MLVAEMPPVFVLLDEPTIVTPLVVLRLMRISVPVLPADNIPVWDALARVAANDKGNAL